MDHGHPIRVVARKTGMSPHLIRMWERRHLAVKPHRTATGRRLYSDAEIERLALLRRCTLEGESIGQIAQLSKDQLRALLPETDSQPDRTATVPDRNAIDHHLELCLRSMKDLDSAQLETMLLRASVSLGQGVFLEELLQPLLELTGEMWSDGRLSVAHEHLASAVVRSMLGSMHLSNSNGSLSPLIISTTPSGQLHEFGALMALVSAASGGWRTLYLGPDLPAEDIAKTTEDRKADAIALSVVYPADDPHLAVQLRKIRQMAPGQIPLLVGGRSATAYDQVLREIGAIRIGGLTHLKKELDRLKQGYDASLARHGAPGV